MRIGGSNGIGTEDSYVLEGNKPKAGKAKDAQDTPATEPASFSRSDQRYISKASACEDVNSQAVAEAKKLLESGQLETSEAIRRVAERILSEGI